MDDNEYYAAMRREKTIPLSQLRARKPVSGNGRKSSPSVKYQTWQGREDAEMLIEKDSHSNFSDACQDD